MVEKIKGMGGRAMGIQADVTKSKAVASMVQEALNEFGGVDILVNNAGGSPRRKVTEMSEKSYTLHVSGGLVMT